MVTGELVLMFQAPHVVSMMQFCKALEGCSGLSPKKQELLASQFSRMAIEFSRFWNNCMATQYWEHDLEQLSHETTVPHLEVATEPSIKAVDVPNVLPTSLERIENEVSGNMLAQFSGDHLVADVHEAILRSQKAVSRAMDLQRSLASTMGDLRTQWSRTPTTVRARRLSD